MSAIAVWVRGRLVVGCTYRIGLDCRRVVSGLARRKRTPWEVIELTRIPPATHLDGSDRAAVGGRVKWSLGFALLELSQMYRESRDRQSLRSAR